MGMVFMTTFYPLMLPKCDIINHVVQNMPFEENLFSLGRKLRSVEARGHDFLISAYREAAIHNNKKKEGRKDGRKKGKGREGERKTGRGKVRKGNNESY